MIGTYFIIAACALVVLQVFSLRIERAAQPLRLSLANEGEQLLASDDLTLEAQQFVEFLLKTAFSMRAEFIVGIMIVPVIALIALFWPTVIVGGGFNISRTNNPETEKRYYSLCRRHHTITAANNPILFFLVMLEMTCLIVPALVVHSAFVGVLSPVPGPGALIASAIELLNKRNFGKGSAAAA